jgi:CHASE2 domain-containing sensor protein
MAARRLGGVQAGNVGRTTNTPPKEDTMGLVVALLILALLVGGAGLFLEGVKWLLIVALILFVASFFTGYRGRSVV